MVPGGTLALEEGPKPCACLQAAADMHAARRGWVTARARFSRDMRQPLPSFCGH